MKTLMYAPDKSVEWFCESPSVNKSIVTSPMESPVMFKDNVVQEAKANENALDIVPLQCPRRSVRQRRPPLRLDL